MKRIGITGPTGAGKTTALGALEDLGAWVIDADRVYHDLLANSAPLRAALADRFGPSILDGEGQKWKWIFYDADYGLFNSKFDSPTSYLKESGAGQQQINNTLIRKLLENDEMLHKFLTRLGEIFHMLWKNKILIRRIKRHRIPFVLRIIDK